MDIDEPRHKQVANADRELLQAIRDNDLRRVAAWLAHGARANCRDEQGRTPLFLAAAATKEQAIAELLLEHGADVRVRTVSGLTPLHVAAAVGDEARIRLFLDTGRKLMRATWPAGHRCTAPRRMAGSRRRRFW